MKEEIKSLIIGGITLSISIVIIFFKPYIPAILLFPLGGIISIAIPYSLIIIIGMLVLLQGGDGYGN